MTIPEDKRHRLQQIAQEVTRGHYKYLQLVEAMNAKMVERGRILTQVKKALSSEELFEDWLRVEFGIELEEAEKMMNDVHPELDAD